MQRTIQPNTVLTIASHNPGKVSEIRALLSTYNVQVQSSCDVSVSEPDETGSTFRENAIIKAVTTANSSGTLCLADDSGLSIDVLGGSPGIYSARWAGENKDFNLAIKRVEEEVMRTNSKPPWRATFNCTLCLAWPDAEFYIFEGIVEGHLVFPPRGSNGFGYDPIFRPVFSSLTFAEMSAEEKQVLNHRSIAFQKMTASVFENQ